jgi:hypothetical protein
VVIRADQNIETRVTDLNAAGIRMASPPHILFDPINLFFLSAGLRIWNEHIKVSSTLIIAPALSNSPQ